MPDSNEGEGEKKHYPNVHGVIQKDEPKKETKDESKK